MVASHLYAVSTQSTNNKPSNYSENTPNNPANDSSTSPKPSPKATAYSPNPATTETEREAVLDDGDEYGRQ